MMARGLLVSLSLGRVPPIHLPRVARRRSPASTRSTSALPPRPRLYRTQHLRLLPPRYGQTGFQLPDSSCLQRRISRALSIRDEHQRAVISCPHVALSGTERTLRGRGAGRCSLRFNKGTQGLAREAASGIGASGGCVTASRRLQTLMLPSGHLFLYFVVPQRNRGGAMPPRNACGSTRSSREL